jgi:peptidoglycan hydrolase-like protein with peptidoglycan-binding domain
MLPARALSMDWRIHLPAVCFAVAIQGAAIAATPFTSNHPEEAYPDNAPSLTSAGPYSDLMRQVQERLHALGFDAGPVNGEVTSKTQAALVQFQILNLIPASGALDDQTLAGLGVERKAPPAEG